MEKWKSNSIRDTFVIWLFQVLQNLVLQNRGAPGWTFSGDALNQGVLYLTNIFASEVLDPLEGQATKKSDESFDLPHCGTKVSPVYAIRKA